jgi:hypothetical protein
MYALPRLGLTTVIVRRNASALFTLLPHGLDKTGVGNFSISRDHGDRFMENVPIYEGRGDNDGIMNVKSRGDPHRHLLIERIEDTIRCSYQTLLGQSDIHIDPSFGMRYVISTKTIVGRMKVWLGSRSTVPACILRRRELSRNQTTGCVSST